MLTSPAVPSYVRWEGKEIAVKGKVVHTNTGELKHTRHHLNISGRRDPLDRRHKTLYKNIGIGPDFFPASARAALISGDKTPEPSSRHAVEL